MNALPSTVVSYLLPRLVEEHPHVFARGKCTYGQCRQGTAVLEEDSKQPRCNRLVRVVFPYIGLNYESWVYFLRHKVSP